MAMAIVPLKLVGSGDYEYWSACMKNYLLAHDLWDIIDSPNGTEPPNQEVAEAEYKAWRKKNATVLHAIQISCSPFNVSCKTAISTDSAKVAWDNLANLFRKPLQAESKGNAGNIPNSDCDDDCFDDDTDYVSSDEEKEPLTSSQPKGAGIVDDDYVRFADLVKYVGRGDWHSTRNFLDRHPGVINAKITPLGYTALHIAILSGNVEIARNLVELMSKEGLAIQDYHSHTALHRAAYRGITKLVRYIVEKNETLVAMANHWKHIPVASACANGHRDTTIYLLLVTPSEVLSQEKGIHGALLLQHAITSKMLDIALEIFHRCPSLATAKNATASLATPSLATAKNATASLATPKNATASLATAKIATASLAIAKNAIYQNTALSVLLDASSDLFPSGCQLGFWQRWIYSCIHVGPLDTGKIHIIDERRRELNTIMQQELGKWGRLYTNFLDFIGIKQIYDLKKIHANSSRLLHRMCEHISTLDERTCIEIGVSQVFWKAVQLGLVEFILEMVEISPSFLYTFDQFGRNMIMASIFYRQEKVFNLQYQLTRDNSLVDTFGNTTLHLAGMLSPSTQLARNSGAALQMQRELKWYKEVESLVNPGLKFLRNNLGDTPSQVFSKSHRNLVIEGERWMKSIATHSAMVGAFIITIMFVAAFTVPGGSIQDIGVPVFLNKKAFMTFIISDAISLFASCTSVLLFLGILTCSYAEQDFLISLPRKLIIGLSTLYISIAAMMVAFCAALIIILNGKVEVIIPVISLAGIPMTVSMCSQFPLLVEFFMSTYGPSIFNRKKMHRN